MRWWTACTQHLIAVRLHRQTSGRQISAEAHHVAGRARLTWSAVAVPHLDTGAISYTAATAAHAQVRLAASNA
jgi:hypothetical protein